ncbi:hypothetical protein CDD81_83 [Ophiocordyceps australis]|uniref:Zn(2)-C6 fungal-type domain-containing protein n=1 Tax=Ophiocordyceps australis TaxID=1399860 RepID=A0A2C5YIK2_9HYPO|nr:hypothetical protein CDD81_83 [Ophiocordyceps australis]
MADSSRNRGKLPTAKWGAACAACAAAKAKCIRSDNSPGAKCNRCQRLLKECTGQVHRPRKKRESKPSRTAQIEERLNGLVNLLQATSDLPAPLAAATTATPGPPPLAAAAHQAQLERPASSQKTPSGASTYSRRLTDTHASQSPLASPWAIAPNYNSFALPGCICWPVHVASYPPPESDDVLLQIYRRDMQPVHPFVIIPPSCTAAALGASRPFLMSAIRMAASFRNLRAMAAQMSQLMLHLSDYMLVRSQRSLDLLQGIIVMLGWYQYHCFQHAQMNNLIALAVSLVGELGLNRPPVLREQTSLMVARPEKPAGRTNEERRACAAVWYLNSVMATSFGRLEPMRYSAYLQQCIKELEASHEYETDVTVVFLLRLQHLTDCIHENNCRDTAVDSFHGIPTAPASVYVQAFQSELNRLSSKLPAHLKADKTIQILLHTASLRLYEPPIADMAHIKQLSESLTTGSIGAGTPLDKMYQTNAALRAWFDTWLSMPVASYCIQPATVAAQFVYAIVMLGRWAKLATPRTMYHGGPPMPGTGTSSMSEYTADGRPEPCSADRAESSPCQTAAMAYRRVEGRETCPYETEPGLPAAVAALQSQLQSQPALTVNIPEILSSVCSRMEQANALVHQTCVESGMIDSNIWSFSALKVRITRVKLEQWAELVSAGADACSRESRGANTAHSENNNHEPQTHARLDNEAVNGGNLRADTGQWRGSYPQQNSNSVLQFGSLAQDQTQIQNFLGGTPWTSDVLDGIDPNVWLESYLDWGAVMMNTATGSAEQ